MLHKRYIITKYVYWPVGVTKTFPWLLVYIIELQYSSPNEATNNNTGNKYNIIIYLLKPTGT